MKKIHELPVLTTKKSDKLSSKTVTMNVPEGLVPLIKGTAEGLKNLGVNRTQGEIFNDIYMIYLNSNEPIYQIDNELYTLNELIELSNFKSLLKIDIKEIENILAQYPKEKIYMMRRELIKTIIDKLNDITGTFEQLVADIVEIAEDEYGQDFESNLEEAKQDALNGEIIDKIKKTFDTLVENFKNTISKEIFEIPFDYLMRIDENHTRIIWNIVDKVVLTYDTDKLLDVIFEYYYINKKNGTEIGFRLTNELSKTLLEKYGDEELKRKYKISDFDINNLIHNPDKLTKFRDELTLKIENKTIKYDICDAVFLNLESKLSI